MPPPAQPRQPRRFRRTAIAAAVALIATVLLASAAVWRWHSARRQPVPLEAGWEAVAITIAGADGPEPRGPGRPSEFAEPFGVAISSDGALYVTDGGEAPRIVRISPDGRVEAVAGGARGLADGAGPDARFDTPSAMAVDGEGVLYVADTGNHAVRRIALDGRVTTLAGDGVAGATDGEARHARFNGPIGIAVDARGRVIVADTYNDRVRAIDRDGRVSTIAGGAGAGADDGYGSDARFDTPCGVAVDAAGNIYVADTGNGAIRRIDPFGIVSTLARDLEGGGLRPIGIAAGPDGALFVTDERGRVVELPHGLSPRTLAGSTAGFKDGAGTEARFRRLGGLALAGDGRIVVADAGNRVIRTVFARSRLPLLLPASPLFHPGFDRSAFERTPLLWPIDPMDGPHEIAGTMGEARGIQGAERFHAGIDVRIEQGTWVRAVRGGTVTSPMSSGDFGSLNEWLRIGSLSYVHVRAGRSRQGNLLTQDGFVPGYGADGKLARVRLRRGARFEVGDVIASVNAFNHVHLTVGWPGEEVNPLGFRLPHFEDGIPPTIAARGIHLYDEAWQPIPRPRRALPLLSGRIRIVVDGWDQADGNRPNRRLGLYSLGYQVLKADGTPAPGFEHRRETIEFDRLAAQPDAAALVYAPGSGIPFYRGRGTRFLYIVTNTFRGGAAAEGFLDTTSLPPGPYIVRVHGRDVRGNETVAELKVEIGDRR